MASYLKKHDAEAELRLHRNKGYMNGARLMESLTLHRMRQLAAQANAAVVEAEEECDEAQQECWRCPHEVGAYVAHREQLL